MGTMMKLGLALLASAVVPLQAAERTSAVVDVVWDVGLDVDGHVTALSTKDTTVPKLHAHLEKAIRGWRFTPGTLNGKPAPTKTHLRSQIEVRLVNDSFEIRLLGASTGPDYANRPTVAYPDWMARNHKQGLVLVIAHYDESGAVTEAKPYDLHNRVDAGLVQAALSSAKHWAFAPELVGGHPVAGDVAIPVCFQLAGADPVDCEWKNPRTGAKGAGSDAVALNPAARLDSDVVGRVL